RISLQRRADRRQCPGEQLSGGDEVTTHTSARGGTHDVEGGDESPEAIGNAILAAKRVGNELIAEARAEAARLLRESAAISERLTEQIRAAAAHLEADLAK